MFNWLGKVFLLCIFCMGLSVAQTKRTVYVVDSIEVKKLYDPWATFTSLKSEVLFKKGSSLYGEFSYIFPQAYGSLNETYRSYFWLGYEQALSKRWYGGVSGRMNFVEEGAGSFFTRLNLAHRGKIGSLFFYKEFAFEHLYYANTSNYQRKAEGRIAPSIGLGRIINIAGKELYVGINYRLFLNFDFQQDNVSLYDSRLINRTKLRFDAAYQIFPHVNVSLYYLRDTQYYLTLAQYNINNQIITPEYRLNQITQGLGVCLTYLLFKEKPDKYIPGLPSR
jgi:hypothetical protein